MRHSEDDLSWYDAATGSLPAGVSQILLTSSELQYRIQELGAKISEDFSQRPLVVIGTLKGSFIFLADLVRELHIPVQIQFLCASSYGHLTESSGQVNLCLEACKDLPGRDVLLVDDIVDTGLTLKKVTEALQQLNVRSLHTCCLLDKPSRRKVDFKPDYIGFEIPDHFVVGFGLDCNEQYRNLPYIAIFKPR